MDILKLAAENSPRSKMIYHEDTQALHIGTLDKHCYFVPFAKGQDPFTNVCYPIPFDPPFVPDDIPEMVRRNLS